MTTCSLDSRTPRQASCRRFSSALGRNLRTAARARIRPPSQSGPAAMRSMFHTGCGQDLSARTLESDLRCLSDWQRRYLPNVHSPLGQQILAWLIRNKDQPKPFSHLLVSTSFSPTCVRQLLNQFAVLGLVEVPKSPVTCRRGDVVATPKLQERLEEYAECMKGIISHHRGIGSNSSQSVRTSQTMPLNK
jgi:hypothetical protein